MSVAPNIPEHGEDSNNVDLSEDPFSPANVQILQFITQSRIYDVLMALLSETNPEVARQVIDLHREGKLLGPGPSMTGEFLGQAADL